MLGILNTLEEIAEGINTMEEFVGRLNYLESVIKTAKNNRTAKVTLSTFHSAKGLEFENVYMIDLLEGIIPATTDIEQYNKLREPRILNDFINVLKDIKKDKKYQWYEKEQYYGIQVKIQKEILYPDQNLEKEKQKEILFCLVKS